MFIKQIFNIYFLRIFLISCVTCWAVIGLSQRMPAYAANVTVGGISFDVPDSWAPVPVTGSIRKAQFRVPGAPPDQDGVVIFYHFRSGNGGSTEANIDRWRRQLVLPADQSAATTTRWTTGHHNIVYFQGFGDLHNGPGTILRGYGFLGGIVENKHGRVFIRYSAPRGLVEKSVNTFQKMLRSVTPLK